MSKSRLVITALFIDRQTVAEVAARYGVHRSWVYKLKSRYEAEGDTALDAGPDTIAWHLKLTIAFMYRSPRSAGT